MVKFMFYTVEGLLLLISQFNCVSPNTIIFQHRNSR